MLTVLAKKTTNFYLTTHISEHSSNQIQYHHTVNSMMYTDKHKLLTFSLCTCTSNFFGSKRAHWLLL